MPKSSKKSEARKGGQETQHSIHSDFTLADHADAVSPAAGRIKKGALTTPAKELCGKPSEVVESQLPELAWYEKDLSDFDFEDNCDIDSVEEQNDALAVRHSPKKKVARKQYHHGREYPLDVWFLIGEHVEPECVCQFAAICRASYTVTQSSHFWQHMYDRYYKLKGDKKLIEKLEPKYMNKVHGQKARVIRALFYIYPPFEERVTRRVPFENSPDALEGTLCILMWHKRIKDTWYFYFKFRRQTVSRIDSLAYYSPRHDRFSQFVSDISYNPEDGCCILQVVTSNFISLPVIMGQTLHKTFLSVGHGMRSHKLKLVFTQQRLRDDKVAMAMGTTLIMDPVSNMRVLHWWDPKYPCTAP